MIIGVGFWIRIKHRRQRLASGNTDVGERKSMVVKLAVKLAMCGLSAI
jgi:hypothetical protein